MKPKDYVHGRLSDPNPPHHDFVDLEHYNVGLDIRYARADNFLGRPVYPKELAFLQKPVAEALRRAHLRLEGQGFGILVFDGYRPWTVTKLFHDEASLEQRAFLADPTSGSGHNRGCAVDCSLFRLKDGTEIVMPSGFDEMNDSAWSDYAGGTAEQRRHRDILITVMHAVGFRVLKNEWWHFNHPAAADYPIYDWDFAELAKVTARPRSGR